MFTPVENKIDLADEDFDRPLPRGEARMLRALSDLEGRLGDADELFLQIQRSYAAYVTRDRRRPPRRRPGRRHRSPSSQIELGLKVA